MDFNPKLKAALKRLSATGMWRSNYAPPLYRLLWRLGVKIPPPHFLPPIFHFIFWFILVGLFNEVNHIISYSHTIVVLPAVAGVIAGSLMAWHYASASRKHGLPSWSDFKP